jgi:hypothetical protein
MAALDIFSSAFESGMVPQKHHDAAQNAFADLGTMVPAGAGSFSMPWVLGCREGGAT